MTIRDRLKVEIDHLDENYLNLLYNIVCQFPHIEKQKSKEVSSRDIAAILQDIADNGGLGIDDPLKWQEEVRQDRSLPFREN